MRYLIATRTFLVAAAAVLVACSDLERDNPYDPNTDALIVTLLSPADSTVVRLMTPVTFNVSAKTGFDNSPAGSFYWWRSNLAGLLATSAGFITDSLPAGRHRITVTVADSLNRRGSYSFTLTVLPLPEFGVMITAPPVDTVIIFGSAFTPEAREFVPADRSIIGREWKFGDGSGIPSSTAADPGTVSWDQPGNFQMIYRVVDDRGRVAADTVLVQVLAESSPPVAVILSPAADTTIVRDDSLFFEAFDEETAARIVSRRWLYPAGSGYEGITDDTSHIAGWRKFATPGVFDIIYRVNDLLGVVIDATVRITVNDTLPPPVALIIRPHARDSSLVAGDSVFFAGFLIPDVSSVTQSWDFGTGSGISSDSVKSPGWKVFNNTGSFKVVYQATDMSQRTARDSVNLTVSANQPPSAQIVQPAGNISIGTGVSYTFTAVDLDPEGRSLLRYWLWDPALGFTPSVADSARNAGSRTFGTAGTFRVSYHVVDDKGLHAADTLTVTVSANQAPAAAITSPAADTIFAAWAEIAFSATDSDPDGTIASRVWNFGALSGLAPESTAVTAFKYFGNAGTFTVRYTVLDNLFASASDSVRVTVTANSRPEAMIISPAGQQTITAGDSLSFIATDSDPDGVIALRYWNYGTGSGLTQDSTSIPDYRKFNNAGNFTVVYKVRDNSGGVKADTILVTVNP